MNEVQIAQNDHLRGNPEADVVIVEYGDFQCPYCARAHATLDALREQYGERIALVYRHLPLAMHPYAQEAAEAAEAAGAQGRFWEMHDALFAHQAQLAPGQLPLLARQLGLDGGRFEEALGAGAYRERVRGQAQAGKALGAHGTPSFFINGERYEGDSDPDLLTAAVERYL